MHISNRIGFLLAASMGLLVLGSVLTITFGVRKGLWDVDGAPCFETHLRCSQQAESRTAREETLRDEARIVAQRLDTLNIILTSPDHPAFASARTSITEEKARSRMVNRRLKALTVQSVKKGLPFIVVRTLLTMLVSLVGVYLIQKHAATVPGYGKLLLPRKTYWVIVGVIFGTEVLREVITSVLAVEKSWYGFSSFCVSTGAWFANLVFSLGLAMLIAVPLAFLWLYSASARCPAASVDLDAPDGQCGVGAYLFFAQTWAVLPTLTVIVVTGLIFRYLVNELRVSPAYMTAPVLLMVLFGIVGIRFVRGAIAIRNTYHSILLNRGTKWADILATKPAPDPTMRFIGEHWWRLPAVVLGFLGVLWSLLAWFGFFELIRGG